MKSISVLNLFLLAAFVVSCGGPRTNSQYNNPPEFIEMSVSPYAYKTPPEAVELTITNNSEETAQFGANYTIEKFSKGEWEEFELPNFAVIAIMYMLQPGQTQMYRISLFPDQVKYTPGRYRIVKSVHLDINGPAYYTAEFSIE